MPANALKFRPQVEVLEGRVGPATTKFILDFTPDGGGARFSDAFFKTKTADGYAPRFLDFNGDGTVNSTDVQLAAPKIANKVHAYFRSYMGNNLEIRYGDVTSNTNVGKQWLNSGRQSSSLLVAVMYLGGRGRQADTLGEAYEARPGYNVEGSGNIYTDTLAKNLLARNRNATPTDFVNYVASTTAHELAHMLGVRHVTSGPSTNLMWSRSKFTTGVDNLGFVNQSVNTDNGYQQNAHTEIINSLRGQKTQTGQVAWALTSPNPPSNPPQGDLSAVRNAVLTVEARMPWSYVDQGWRTRRDGWMSAVRSASSASQLGQLVYELEVHTLWSAVKSGWASRRPGWVSEVRAATSATKVHTLLNEFQSYLV